MEEKIKVKLLVDLTRYADGLVEGSEGYTVGNNGLWSRANDNFVTVCFPEIATLDVLWKSLEIIDEEYLKRAEESNKEWKEQLKSAKDVELHLGPRGGFRSLQFKYKETIQEELLKLCDKGYLYNVDTIAGNMYGKV